MSRLEIIKEIILENRTNDSEKFIREDGIEIEVMPAWKFIREW